MPKLRLDVVKTLFEIAAIVIGGSWVLLMFWVKDCPNLERRMGANAQIQWRRTGDRCEADLFVAIENNGGRPVNVRSVSVRGWIFDGPTGTSAVAYFDPAAVAALHEKSALPSPDPANTELLVTHYPVGGALHQALEWSFAADRSKTVYFEVRVEAEGVKHVPLASTWDRVCGAT